MKNDGFLSEPEIGKPDRMKLSSKVGTSRCRIIQRDVCLVLVLLSVSGHHLACSSDDGTQASRTETQQLSVSGIPTSAIPSGWVPSPRPQELGEDIYQCLGYAYDRDWVVSGHEEVEVTLREPLRTKWYLPFDLNLVEMLPDAHDEIRDTTHVHTTRMGDGWLVGLNAGEWGGGLWWFDEAGQGRKLLGEKKNVNWFEVCFGFVSLSDRVLAMMGLDHQGYRSGRVVQVRFINSQLDVGVLTELGAAPRAWVTDSDSVLVLTHRGLHRVSASGEDDFSGLTTKYETSLVKLPSGLIYIGMRFFVLCLIPEGRGYRELWLVPEDCQRFEIRDYQCVCLGQAPK